MALSSDKNRRTSLIRTTATSTRAELNQAGVPRVKPIASDGRQRAIRGVVGRGEMVVTAGLWPDALRQGRTREPRIFRGIVLASAHPPRSHNGECRHLFAARRPSDARRLWATAESEANTTSQWPRFQPSPTAARSAPHRPIVSRGCGIDGWPTLRRVSGLGTCGGVRGDERR